MHLITLNDIHTHTHTHTQTQTNNTRLLWTSDQPDAKSLPDTTTSTKTYMLPTGFVGAVTASERPQTNALDGAATAIGQYVFFA